MFQRIYHWIQKAEEFSLIVCMFAIVFLMTLQVITRYLVVLPAPWSAELGTFSLVWMVFLGAAVAARRNRHVRVESIFSRLPDTVQYYVQIFIYIVILLILAVLSYYGFIRAQMSSSSILPATRIPMTTIMISVPIACLVMILHYILALYKHLRLKPGGDAS
jgi:TRAP-type C4-dicarboxylate transport system permease small subunit